MISKKFIKAILHIAMLFSFVAYCLTFFIGKTTHPLIGIALEVFVVSHVFSNGKDFLSNLKNLFSHSFKLIEKWNCIVDILLIVFYVSMGALEIMLFAGGETFLLDSIQTIKILQLVDILIVFILIFAHAILHIKISRQKILYK